MKHPLLASALLIGLVTSAGAGLPQWQTEVAAGTTASVTWFTDEFTYPASGREPAIVELGDIGVECSFEFIVNAGHGGPSGALIGIGGVQAIKFEQWNNSGVLGITDYGVADHLSEYTPPLNQDTHLVLSSDGTDTFVYVDGALQYTFFGVPLTLSGPAGLAGTVNAELTAFGDLLDGRIAGFAAYGSALPESEIAAHAAAYRTGLPVVSLPAWQAAVTSEGATPAFTHFETVSGFEPLVVDTGALTGDRTFEFVASASAGGPSQALIGTGGVQGLKFEQWQDTGTFGLTDFGVADHDSGVPFVIGEIFHVAYVSDDVSTTLFVNGEPAGVFDPVPLLITGPTGLASAVNIPPDEEVITYTDPLDGTVLRFAAYNTALTEADIAARHTAFEADGGAGAFTAWQAATATGAAASFTHFEPVEGAAPVVVDVGELDGPRSLEFIVNAFDSTQSACLLGQRSGGLGDGLKFEQWNDTGAMGMTQFGVSDLATEVFPPLGEDTHIVFVSDEFETSLWVDGELVHVFEVPLSVSGRTGLAAAAAITPGGAGDPTFFDPFDGHIFGFASYDTALTEAEVAAHYEALTAGGPVVPPTADFRILSVARNSATGEVTLTWNSTAGRSYGIVQSDGLAGGSVVVPSVAATAAQTSHTFAPAATESPRVFFHVVENQPAP